MSADAEGGLLTLEPLIEAVRDGVVAVGWELSGLQKTTSHQFKGRWEGDSTRSAYLFFHDPDGPEWASVDVFLDETSQGLSGNLALVVDAGSLARLGDVRAALGTLGGLAREHLPREYRTPVTLRFRLERPDADPASADSEIRFKVRIPRAAIGKGAATVFSLASAAAMAFRALLGVPRLHGFLESGPYGAESDPGQDGTA